MWIKIEYEPRGKEKSGVQRFSHMARPRGGGTVSYVFLCSKVFSLTNKCQRDNQRQKLGIEGHGGM